MNGFWIDTAPWIVLGLSVLFLGPVALLLAALAADAVRGWLNDRRQIARLERLFDLPAREPVGR